VAEIQEQFLMQLALMALSALLGGAVSAVKSAHRDRMDDRREYEQRLKADRDVVQLLLYYRLKDEYHVHMGKGEPMTPAARRDIDRMYHLYHEMYGGNGGGTAMYEAMCELPIKG
jgi:hypothetical protein